MGVLSRNWLLPFSGSYDVLISQVTGKNLYWSWQTLEDLIALMFIALELHWFCYAISIAMQIRSCHCSNQWVSTFFSPATWLWSCILYHWFQLLAVVFWTTLSMEGSPSLECSLAQWPRILVSVGSSWRGWRSGCVGRTDSGQGELQFVNVRKYVG